MNAHTPGPWQGCLHLRSNADETCGCGYRGGIWSRTADVMVCEIGGPVGHEGDDMIPRSDRPTQIADHWLIAAAPDMLAALRAVVGHDHSASGKDALARAAIAKATGRDST